MIQMTGEAPWLILSPICMMHTLSPPTLKPKSLYICHCTDTVQDGLAVSGMTLLMVAQLQIKLELTDAWRKGFLTGTNIYTVIILQSQVYLRSLAIQARMSNITSSSKPGVPSFFLLENGSNLPFTNIQNKMYSSFRKETIKTERAKVWVLDSGRLKETWLSHLSAILPWESCITSLKPQFPHL